MLRRPWKTFSEATVRQVLSDGRGCDGAGPPSPSSVSHRGEPRFSTCPTTAVCELLSDRKSAHKKFDFVLLSGCQRDGLGLA